MRKSRPSSPSACHYARHSPEGEGSPSRDRPLGLLPRAPLPPCPSCSQLLTPSYKNTAAVGTSTAAWTASASGYRARAGRRPPTRLPRLLQHRHKRNAGVREDHTPHPSSGPWDSARIRDAGSGWHRRSRRLDRIRSRARRVADQALELARAHGEAGSEAAVLVLLGDIAVVPDPSEI